MPRFLMRRQLPIVALNFGYGCVRCLLIAHGSEQRDVALR